MMKKKILGSITLCGVLFSSSQAVSFEAFGHIGTAYSFGIDKISKENGEKERPWFGGATARVGFEVGMGPVSLGLGVAGGLPYAISPSGEFSDFVKDVYFTRASDVKWYNWISDAYLRVDTRYFSFIGGRYDLSTFFDGKNGQIANGVDWFSGLSEGLSFRLESRYVNWWGIYSYETMDFGARNPGRIGNDLMGYHQYQKNGVDDAHYFSSGIDINIDDMVYIDPFSAYLLQGGDDILQAGGKLEFVFGGKSILSDTTIRGMYQNSTKNTYLWWIDQEFVFGDMFKLGGGYYSVGNDAGIYHQSDKTRFYGNTFGGGSDYFAAGSDVWYVFAGFTHKYFELDLLYADKDYKEISAVAQVNLINNRWAKFSVGGGYIRENSFDRGIAFTKLSF